FAQRGTWALLQLGSTECPADCEQLLYLTRQAVKGLGKDKDRIERLLITPKPLSQTFTTLIQTQHPDLKIHLLDTTPIEAITPSRPLLLLMDPNGNIMMHYPLETAGKPMLEDLKHLLKLSNIG
ncbi:MAG: hypothetical protein ACR2PJ_00150, partial [Pseudomonadales bacterium]